MHILKRRKGSKRTKGYTKLMMPSITVILFNGNFEFKKKQHEFNEVN